MSVRASSRSSELYTSFWSLRAWGVGFGCYPRLLWVGCASLVGVLSCHGVDLRASVDPSPFFQLLPVACVQVRAHGGAQHELAVAHRGRIPKAPQPTAVTVRLWPRLLAVPEGGKTAGGRALVCESSSSSNNNTTSSDKSTLDSLSSSLFLLMHFVAGTISSL